MIPCTTQGKDNNRFYKKITSLDFISPSGVPLTSYIMISHARTIAINRFVRSKGSLSPEEFYETKKLLQGVYF